MEFKNLVNEAKDDEVVKHVVYYNAFTEDLFSWDNDLENDSERKLKINKNSSFIDLIERQGKENEIAEKFKEFTSSKIEPNINTKTGEITFSLPTGDEEAVENIKISKHFLGYDSWKDLINEDDKDSYIKRINLYSHSNHSALEVKELEHHEKEFLKRIYEKFISEYKWKE